MKKVEVEPIDVNNDAMMIAAGLRQPSVKPRDPSVWSKTDKERKLWKRYRRFPIPEGNWPAPIKSSRFVGVLIVNVKGMDKTTFSHKCSDVSMPDILSRYKSETCTIVRAFWNGKEINPESLYKPAV